MTESAGGKLPKVSSTVRDRMEPESFREFLDTVGASDHSAWITYLTRFRDSEFELIQTLGYSLERTLHGEQKYECTSWPNLPCDMEYETAVERSVEKKSGTRGTMTFVTMRTEFRTEGKTFAKAWATFIFI